MITKQGNAYRMCINFVIFRVQEAIKKKENVAKFKSFQGRCINSTNKVKGFWELLKGKKCDKTKK